MTRKTFLRRSGDRGAAGIALEGTTSSFAVARGNKELRPGTGDVTEDGIL